MAKLNKTLIDLRKLQLGLDLTKNDLLYVVDEKVSKATTIGELIEYFSKNVDLTKLQDNLYIVSNEKDGTTPALRYDTATKKWQYSNNGKEYADIGSMGVATTEKLGCVIVGNGLVIDEHGVLSLDFNKVFDDTITISFEHLKKEEDEESITYSFSFNSLRLFDIYEEHGDNDCLIYPSAVERNEEKGVTTIKWHFTKGEEEVGFENISWNICFGK